MKRILNLSSLLLILILFAAGCGKDPKIENEFGNGASKGSFSLKLGTVGSFEVVSRAADVAVDDFTVRIKGTTLKETAYDSTWTRYGDMPAIVTIPAGSYTIEAYNGEQRSGFNSPYYYGSKEFSVGIQELTDAQVTCQLACVKISVEFSALFLNNVTAPVCIIHQTNGAALEFAPDDQNMTGYLATPGDSTLSVTIRGKYAEDNSEVNRTYFINSVASKQWHKITLSVNTSAGIENGGGMIQIDHSVDEKESTILVPGAGDIIENNGDSGSWDDDGPGEGGGDNPGGGDDPNAPVVAGIGFNIDNTLNFSASTPDPQVDVKITAIESIDSLVVEIVSPALDEAALVMVGLAKKFDIANVEPGMQSSLTDLGLIAEGDPIKGKTEHTFSVGSFMPMLGMLSNGVGNVHKFHLRIVDTKKNVTEKSLVINLTE